MALPRRSILLALALVCASSASLFAAEAIRKWSDATGKFSVQARLVSFDGGVVKLAKEDGSEISLPVDRLSAGDQEYVRAYDSANPFRPRTGAAPPNPFFPSGTPSGAATGSTVAAPGTPASPAPRTAEEVEPVVWSAVPTIDPKGPAGPLTVQLEPAPLPEKIRTVPIKLPPKIDFWDRDHRFLLDWRSQTALLCSVVAAPTKTAVTAVIQVDLAGGASSPPIPMTGIAVHAWDGVERRIVVSQMHKGFGDEDLPVTIEVWKVTDKEFIAEFYAQPSDRARFGSEETVWATFLPGNRFATLSDTGRLAVWSIDEKKPLVTANLERDAKVAVSHDGRVIALASGDAVGFVDSQTFARVGGIDSLPNRAKAIAFSPDGKRFAVGAVGGGVWNLVDGTKISDFDADDANGFFFADAESVYAGGTVYDAKSGIRLLQIRPTPALALGHADRMFVVAEERAGRDELRKLFVALPRPARTEEKITAILEEPDSFLFPPGEPVRIDVNLVPPETRDGIAAKLREAAEAAGHAVADGASVMLEARLLVPTEPISIPYRTIKEGEPPQPPPINPRINSGIGAIGAPPPIFNGPGGIGGSPFGGAFQPPDPYADLPKADVKPPIIAVRLNLFGQDVWSDRRSPTVGYPMMIVLKENDTVEDFIDRLELGDARCFGTFSVPKSIAKPGVRLHPAHGYWKLTIDGLEKDGS